MARMFGVGAVVAASIVPPNKQASAIGLMFFGLTLANILGVPLGTLIGQKFGWRATFWRDHALGLIALIPVVAARAASRRTVRAGTAP